MSVYDAFLLLSFGGPEGPDDVLPFLRNVTRGRGVPPERLAEVAGHYQAFGGSDRRTRSAWQLLAVVGADFTAHGLDIPLYWGNRNWQPYLVDTIGQMAADGVRRAVAFVTSAYSSYSACRSTSTISSKPGPPSAGRAGNRQGAPLLQPPWLHRAVRRRRQGGAGLPARRPPCGGPAGVHRAQCPGRHGGCQRQPARRHARGPLAAGRRGAVDGRLVGPIQAAPGRTGAEDMPLSCGKRPASLRNGSARRILISISSTKVAAARPVSRGSARTSVIT